MTALLNYYTYILVYDYYSNYLYYHIAHRLSYQYMYSGIISITSGTRKRATMLEYIEALIIVPLPGWECC
jgi:hypothetical protein